MKLRNEAGLSVILPVYNERENITQTLFSVSRFLARQDHFNHYEIIVVDDGSLSETAKILRECQSQMPEVKISTHDVNKGYGRALLTGMRTAMHPWVLLMDADGQFDIREIDKFIPYMDTYGIITGYREKRRDPFARVLVGKVYLRLARMLFGLQFKDLNCGFKLIRKEILDLNDVASHAGVFYTEILLRIKNRGFQIKEIPVKHYCRTKGVGTGASPKVVLGAIVDLIKLKFRQWEQCSA